MVRVASAQAAGRQAGAARGGPAPNVAVSVPSVPAVLLDRSVPQWGPAPVLDPEQRAVVDHRSGHLLVLAGPGTGKTATLAELIASRVRDAEAPVPAERILALTFGRRAARELADRVGQRLGGGPVPIVSTFHSFAYATLRQHQEAVAFASPLRLLTAAEQDARLRELLTHAVGEGRLAWPESLSAAVGTRGMAEHMRELLARARGLGLDGRQLARIGRGARIPVWTAVGRFFEEYLDVLGFEGVLDYAELMHEVVALASKEREGRALRESYRMVVVDEFQDTDPAQVRLLQELARGGAQIVAVGDPDQAIYGFRGADVGGILGFPRRFGDPLTGRDAPIVVLRTNRRCAPAIAQAARGVLGSVPMAGLPAHVQRVHRSAEVVDRPGVVQAFTYPSTSAQATGVADILLRARAGIGADAIGWSDMAVLVRTPVVDSPPIARALRAAGIPVEVPGDEVALADEPAVRALLSVVALALDPEAHGIAAPNLLAGPLGGLDAIEIRAIARALHRARSQAVGRIDPASGLAPGSAASGGPAPVGPAPAGPAPVGSAPVGPAPVGPAPGGPVQSGPVLGVAGSGGTAPGTPIPDGRTTAPTSAADRNPDDAEAGVGSRPADVDADRDVPGSDRLLAEAVCSGIPRGVRLPAAARAGMRRVTRAVRAARRILDESGMVSEVLWAVWTATDWPQRLRSTALHTVAGTSPADRDLDAVIALFDLANRLPAQRAGRIGMVAFLSDIEAQRLPQTSGLAQHPTGERVRLLSAHRAKGLEWELVVVAGVQEGQWPDLRLRSDLLRIDELGPRGRVDPPSYAERLAEERRLMYVACTRARSALHVTAVAEPGEAGAQPSRFLADLGVPLVAMPSRAANPMTAGGLVAALRAAAAEPPRVLADGQPDPEVERRRGAAIQRLAALTVALRDGRLGGGGGPLAAADPRAWWGMRSPTALPGPGEPDRPHDVPGADSAGHLVLPGAPSEAGSPSAPAGSASPACSASPAGSASMAGSAASAGSPSAPGAPAGLPQPPAGPRPPGGPSGLQPHHADGSSGPDVVRLSPSAVESLRSCPLRWFLDRRVGAGPPAGGAAAVGRVVHAVAEAIGRGEVPPDAEAIGALVDQMWARIPFPARYQQAVERRRVDEMIGALLAWHRSSDRTVAAVEAPFVLEVDAGRWQARVSGTVDRIDRDPAGALRLVDFKTGRSAATAAAASEHPQLGIYQLAAREGALELDAPAVQREPDDPQGAPPRQPGAPGIPEELGRARPEDRATGPAAPDPEPLGAPGARLGGAELVHLGDRFVSGMPKVRHQAALGAGHTWVHDVLLDAARLATGPSYPARPGPACSSCAFRMMCPAHAPGRPGGSPPGPAAAGALPSGPASTALGAASPEPPSGPASSEPPSGAASSESPSGPASPEGPGSAGGGS